MVTLKVANEEFEVLSHATAKLILRTLCAPKDKNNDLSKYTAITSFISSSLTVISSARSPVEVAHSEQILPGHICLLVIISNVSILSLIFGSDNISKSQ